MRQVKFPSLLTWLFYLLLLSSLLWLLICSPSSDTHTDTHRHTAHISCHASVVGDGWLSVEVKHGDVRHRSAGGQWREQTGDTDVISSVFIQRIWGFQQLRQSLQSAVENAHVANILYSMLLNKLDLQILFISNLRNRFTNFTGDIHRKYTVYLTEMYKTWKIKIKNPQIFCCLFVCINNGSNVCNDV